MKLLNLAIAWAVFALVGLGVFFFQDPRLGLAMIVLGELAAFICVWVDERRQRQYWERKYIMRRIGA